MQQSRDSYRYYAEKIGSQERFFKEYKEDRISKTILEIYHVLHNHLSKQEKDVYFGDITLDGKKIEKWNIRILPLDPQGIYESTEITTKNKILITNPEYIQGKTLQDYEDQLGQDTAQSICDAITKYIEAMTKMNFTDMYGVIPVNVKVNIKNTTAELIVTDISCNIKNFFHSGKNAVILDTLCKNVA